MVSMRIFVLMVDDISICARLPGRRQQTHPVAASLFLCDENSSRCKKHRDVHKRGFFTVNVLKPSYSFPLKLLASANLK